MVIGALADAGLDVKEWAQKMSTLPIFTKKADLPFRFSKVQKNGISSTYFNVTLKEEFCHRGLKDIEDIIQKSKLSGSVKEKTIKVFTVLAKAESKVHRVPINKIHFHEVGAIDAIIDIVGAVLALEMMEINKVLSSPIPLGSGFVSTAHGLLPVPAPATALLLKNIPVYQNDANFEITTPTGAAIITALASRFGNMPLMKVQTIGCGAGTKDYDKPNVLRVFIGESTSQDLEEITIAETNIDDMNPQLFEHVFERLFEAGALDVYIENIIMKKSRPAFKLTALCQSDDVQNISNIILSETTSLGIRMHSCSRIVLPRHIEKVTTKYGAIRVKISTLPDGEEKHMPEYEDCKKAAKKFKIPLQQVYKEIERVYAKN